MNNKKFFIIVILMLGLIMPAFVVSAKVQDRSIEKQREFRERIVNAKNKQEIKKIAKDIRAYHSPFVAKKVQVHAVEVMQKRSDSIAGHLAKLETQGKNIDEAETILQEANVKIANLEGDTVQEVQAGIQEIYKLFASIAKAVK